MPDTNTPQAAGADRSDGGRPWLAAPLRAAAFMPPDPDIRVAGNGTIYVSERTPLGPYPRAITEYLIRHAAEAPDRVFLADRKGGGDWRILTYGAALEGARALGQALLDAGLSADRPLAILSGNDIDHGLLALAALHVGVPYAAISPAYALLDGARGRLRECFAAVTPGMVYAADAAAFAPAIAEVAPDLPVFADTAEAGARALSELRATTPTAAVEAAHAAITPDTIAKFLFTSGSTGTPKAVPNTHRMICSNQQATRQVYAFVQDQQPVILDWAPWHHTAGGNVVYFLALANGGSLYIDDGRPTKADIHRTVANLRGLHPTWYFNVPTGYDALIPHLEADAELREGFFRDLNMLWYAGAAMAQHTWDALERLSVAATGTRIVLGTGLGATETAPGALMCTWPMEQPGNVGLPIPGVTLKLVPMEGKYDARVKGDNIMPGYWRRPDVSAQAFDDEGFYRFGDALKPYDPDDLSRGFLFDGRTAENFKLDTGTWVSTGPLRMKVVEHFGGLVRDVAITGADRPWLGGLVFLRDPDRADDPALRAELRDRLRSLAAAATGSSNRIRRILIVPDAPSMAAGEVTDKGSLNQRAVLSNRPELVEEIYGPATARIIDIDEG